VQVTGLKPQGGGFVPDEDATGTSFRAARVKLAPFVSSAGSSLSRTEVEKSPFSIRLLDRLEGYSNRTGGMLI
jgi:hypothetical protein